MGTERFGRTDVQSFRKIFTSCCLTFQEGMLRDARRAIGAEDKRFEFHVFDCHRIPYEEGDFDLVIANHVLFYCEDIPKVAREVKKCSNGTEDSSAAHMDAGT